MATNHNIQSIVACYLKSARFSFAVLLAFPFNDAAKVKSKAPKPLNVY